MQDDGEDFNPGSTDPGTRQSDPSAGTERESATTTEETASESAGSDTQDQWIERLNDYQQELESTTDTARRKELIENIKKVEDGLIEKGILDETERSEYSVTPEQDPSFDPETDGETASSDGSSDTGSSSGSDSQHTPSEDQSTSESDPDDMANQTEDSTTQTQDSTQASYTTGGDSTQDQGKPTDAETTEEASDMCDNDSAEDGTPSQDLTDGKLSTGGSLDPEPEADEEQARGTQGQTAKATNDREESADDDGPTTIKTQESGDDSLGTQDSEEPSPSQSDSEEIGASNTTTEDASSEVADETDGTKNNTAELEPIPDTEETPDVEALTTKLAELEDTFEEFKRSNKHEHQEIRKYSVESFAENMLRVRDTLERAVELFEWESDKQARMEAIISQFDQQFTSGEIAPIEPERGVLFDYDRHEVVGREEAADLDSDEIIRVERKGFELEDRVLRPAQIVIVS